MTIELEVQNTMNVSQKAYDYSKFRLLPIGIWLANLTIFCFAVGSKDSASQVEVALTILMWELVGAAMVSLPYALLKPKDGWPANTFFATAMLIFELIGTLAR